MGKRKDAKKALDKIANNTFVISEFRKIFGMYDYEAKDVTKEIKKCVKKYLRDDYTDPYEKEFEKHNKYQKERKKKIMDSYSYNNDDYNNDIKEHNETKKPKNKFMGLIK